VVVDRVERIAVRARAVDQVGRNQHGHHARRGQRGPQPIAQAAVAWNEQQAQEPRKQERQRRDSRQTGARSYHARQHGVPDRWPPIAAQQRVRRQHHEEGERVVAPAVDAPGDHPGFDRHPQCGEEADPARDREAAEQPGGHDGQQRERGRREADGHILLVEQPEEPTRDEQEDRLADAPGVESTHLPGGADVGERVTAHVRVRHGREAEPRRPKPGHTLRRVELHFARPRRVLERPVARKERVEPQRAGIEKDNGRQGHSHSAPEPPQRRRRSERPPCRDGDGTGASGRHAGVAIQPQEHEPAGEPEHQEPQDLQAQPGEAERIVHRQAPGAGHGGKQRIGVERPRRAARTHTAHVQEVATPLLLVVDFESVKARLEDDCLRDSRKAGFRVALEHDLAIELQDRGIVPTEKDLLRSSHTDAPHTPPADAEEPAG